MNYLIGLIVLVIGMSSGWWLPRLFPDTDATLMFAVIITVSAALGWIAGDITFR